MMMNTAQPMNMALAPTQPMKTLPDIPLNLLLTILQKIINKRIWITTLYTRHREWGLLKRHHYWTRYKM